MKNRKAILIFSLCVVVLSVIASATGIFYTQGNGSYEYQTIRNEKVTIYGKGIYQHMSADVAIQGIAQDYITLFIAVPLLLLALYLTRRGTVRSAFFLAGVLNYFFVTYLFYMQMAMYNALFIVYVLLVSASFFSFVLVLMEFDIKNLPSVFSEKTPVKFAGRFLVFMSSAIALLWLQIVISPLLDGTIIPKAVEHYTTLTVQAFDLSIFLPIAFLSGILLIKEKSWGYLMSPVTLVFLCFLMTALVAKIIAMAISGVNVIPVVFIIPAFDITAIVGAILIFRNILSGHSLQPDNRNS